MRLTLAIQKSINVAIKSCKTDVVLLNSDTEVTPTGLIICTDVHIHQVM